VSVRYCAAPLIRSAHFEKQFASPQHLPSTRRPIFDATCRWPPAFIFDFGLRSAPAEQPRSNAVSRAPPSQVGLPARHGRPHGDGGDAPSVRSSPVLGCHQEPALRFSSRGSPPTAIRLKAFIQTASRQPPSYQLLNLHAADSLLHLCCRRRPASSHPPAPVRRWRPASRIESSKRICFLVADCFQYASGGLFIHSRQKPPSNSSEAAIQIKEPH